MKEINLTLAAGMILSLGWLPGVFSQKADHYQCHWESGLTPEAGEAFIDKMRYDEKSTFLYYFSNDETNLYIYLIISEKASLQKVMRYGLTTWFNADAKQKKSLGIQFPVPVIEGNGPPARKEGQAPGERKDMMIGLMAAKNKQMILVGFSGKGTRDTVRVSENKEFRAKLEMKDKEKLLVSLSVPISKIESAGKNEPDNMISIGFETGYMDLNRQGIGQTGEAQQGQSGHGGGMYGGPPPGGTSTTGTAGERSSGNSGQADQPDISQLAKPTRLWISPVKLAGK